MRRRLLYLTVTLFAAACLSGCQQKDPEPGDIAGYDEGEEYLSIWVHSIEDTEEGQAYKKSVETFNEAYDGQYFADIEFVPRNDSGGGYSDKVNASVMAGGLPDVLTVDGPNISAYAANGIIQPLAELTEEEEAEYLPSIIEQGTVNDELYALGVMESSVGFYSNKDIIEEAGIEIPDADDPWTWSEFLDILEELKPLMDEKNQSLCFPVAFDESECRLEVLVDPNLIEVYINDGEYVISNAVYDLENKISCSKDKAIRLSTTGNNG